jgi:A nuclease family of the HNH/ENDO VII superfamily with conserved AHH
LWKTFRNVETSEKFPDLWTQFRDDLSSADNGVMATVVGSKDPNLGSNALNRPDQTPPLNIPDHTGHAPSKEKFDPNAINQPGNVPALNLPNHTGHTNAEKPAVTNVFEYTTDYRDNYEKVHGPIPKGYQIHHIAPRAVFNDSGLAQEWVKRGITKLDYPENLEALPQTQDAYDKSSIKIQHSGSHSKWSDHAREVLRETQQELELQYGGLDRVPDDVMQKTKDNVMQQLREDLLDKDLGIEEGWIKPKSSGMDKLSQSQIFDQVG